MRKLRVKLYWCRFILEFGPTATRNAMNIAYDDCYALHNNNITR
jgi:hypothetical protein